ncbi:putative MAPK/MAK/MRK overlapping kinase [Blattamonas nauphoetae]|uniref:MAPK/MAK/MRK overlapping kinase n=1 Tax=Blattamonas nauphoetae TaxID=2049346 RepID=A0ABQ9XF91_9EUKA|nr:putative MAPK/MAK/MRK overlapping kinase [Blattamonas nauphoetae]
MQKYEFLEKIGEGAFSVVYKARSYKTGTLVAIKEMKKVFRTSDDVENLREIQALKRLANHPNIIKLLEVIYDTKTGKLCLVMELMKCNLFDLINQRKHYLSTNKVKFIIYQVLRALDHFHRNGIFHRDIKPENILINGDLVKLADFGSCRGIYTRQPFSEYISTRWYRAPECLLTDGIYNYKMDVWGAGCVWFEILMLYPLFPGRDEVDQIHRIHKVLGTPSPTFLAKLKKSAHMNFDFPEEKGSGLKKLLKGAPEDLVDVMEKMLEYDADKRFNARACLRHPFFRDLYDADRRSASRSSTAATPVPHTPLTPSFARHPSTFSLFDGTGNIQAGTDQPQAQAPHVGQDQRGKKEGERERNRKEGTDKERKEANERERREKERFMNELLSNQLEITKGSFATVIDLNSFASTPNQTGGVPFGDAKKKHDSELEGSHLPAISENQSEVRRKKSIDPPSPQHISLPPLHTQQLDVVRKAKRSEKNMSPGRQTDMSDSPPAVRHLPPIGIGLKLGDETNPAVLTHPQRQNTLFGVKQKGVLLPSPKMGDGKEKKPGWKKGGAERGLIAINGVGLSPTPHGPGAFAGMGQGKKQRDGD